MTEQELTYNINQELRCCASGFHSIAESRLAILAFIKEAGYVKLESWESPRCPSGELQEIFNIAESFRSVEHAPAIRVDHFLLALVLSQSPSIAEDVLKVFQNVKDKWRKSL